VDWRSLKLLPRSSVAVVAIAKAAVSLWDVAALAMATTLGPTALGYGGPQSCRRTSSLLATVRLDGIFTADSENAYLFSVNFHGR